MRTVMSSREFLRPLRKRGKASPAPTLMNLSQRHAANKISNEGKGYRSRRIANASSALRFSLAQPLAHGSLKCTGLEPVLSNRQILASDSLAASGTPDQYPSQEHQHTPHHHLKGRLQEWGVHIFVPYKADDSQL